MLELLANELCGGGVSVGMGGQDREEVPCLRQGPV
jgi:hypothetical protein